MSCTTLLPFDMVGQNVMQTIMFCLLKKEHTHIKNVFSHLKISFFLSCTSSNVGSREREPRGLRIRQWKIAALVVLWLRKTNILMVRAVFFPFVKALPQEKYINKINTVTLARSGVKLTACRVTLLLFLSFSFGWLLLCCSIFKWFYRARTAGHFRVAPLLLFLNNLSALAQCYHAYDNLLWYCVCSRTILHTFSVKDKARPVGPVTPASND